MTNKNILFDQLDSLEITARRLSTFIELFEVKILHLFVMNVAAFLALARRQELAFTALDCSLQLIAVR